MDDCTITMVYPQVILLHRFYIRGKPAVEKIALAREVSPITYVRKDSVPVMLCHREKNRLVSVVQSIALDAGHKAAGAQSTSVIYIAKGHAFGLDDAAVLDVNNL
jgi:hypothetical protein